MRDFKELKVWEKAHQLVLEVYRAIGSFPTKERFSLIPQLRRAAASVPANIAEGCGRGSDCEFSRFLSIAAGSACEANITSCLLVILAVLMKQLTESLIRRLTR
jgi:four helix bundle protein